MQRVISEVTQETLRQAAQVHSESWKAAHRAICSQDFVEKHTTARQAAYLQRRMGEGCRFYLLCCPEPVGLVSVEGSLIADLYVLPEHQGKGHGTALLDHAMSICGGSPRLWVLSSNDRALELYRRLGFHPTGRQTQLREDLWEMELQKDG